MALLLLHKTARRAAHLPLFDRQRTLAFWANYPALAAGISALLGALAYLFPSTLPLSLVYLGYMAWLSWPKLALHATLFSAIWFFAYGLHATDLPVGKTQAVFSIRSVQRDSTPFHEKWRYKGTLTTIGNTLSSLPCTVFWQKEQTRPPANADYLLTGSLQKQGEWDYRFVATDWQPLPRTWSLAELRFCAKERLGQLLSKRLSERSAPFLLALFTGEIEERLLRHEFGRVGLQHILAISGFHFAIVASFAALFARTLFSSKKRLWILLCAVTLYFLFVGNSPPVQRSFLAACFFLLGRILQRRSSGLNLLGASLLIEILLDPLSPKEIGFQLSFLSCFAILLLYSALQRLFRPFFPTRPRSAVFALAAPSQLIYLCSTLFSRALCLTLCVNIALAPFLLYHFHRFPLLSLFYNLFIPQLSALALFLLLLTLSVHLFLPLAALPLFAATDLFATELLEMIAHPPAPLDFVLTTTFPALLLGPYIALLLLLGIHIRKVE